MNRRILAVFAHPDDESFGPGGTLAKYARQNTEIHLLCVTRGESGEIKRQKILDKFVQKGQGQKDIATIREKELLESAKVLGIEKVEFLNYLDGEISNNKYHEIAKKISSKIKLFKPEVILTFENLGVSGHLDHIAVSLITTFVFTKQKIAKKLYYYCIPKWRARLFHKYFIYFPEGYGEEQITTVIDCKNVWKVKTKAMRKHQSQIHDVEKILRKTNGYPKEEYFISFKRPEDINGDIFKETDFFANL